MDALRTEKKAAIIPLQTLTLFIIPRHPQVDTFDLPAETAPVHCVVVDNHRSPRSLHCATDLKFQNVPLSTTPSLEYRKEFLMAVHHMPAELPWLVNGRRVFVFGPETQSVKEMRDLLHYLGADVGLGPLQCDIIMCHRIYQSQIDTLPNLLELKKRDCDFILWGRSFAEESGSQTPVKMFPGAGGMVSITWEALDDDDGLVWCTEFANLTRKHHHLMHWGCVLHPDVHANLVKACDDDARSPEAIDRCQRTLLQVRRMMDIDVIQIATPGEIHPFGDLQGRQATFTLLQRLQFSWSRCHRNFVLIDKPDPERQVGVEMGGIEELTVKQFVDTYVSPPKI
ncbi:hypothetical protein HKX48_006442 [Thoreauomyces humboldtii]|nr:hypothetical protein HKX48_006442 [Thoreauomyces humboldtii]